MSDVTDSNVIDLGEMRFRYKRKDWLKRDKQCRHVNMTIVDVGDFVKCDDCGAQLSAMWVIREMLDSYNNELTKVASREQQVRDLTSKELHLIAARRVEKVWRTRHSVPACPHCERGILPEDNLGSTRINREVELRRRQVDAARQRQDASGET